MTYEQLKLCCKQNKESGKPVLTIVRVDTEENTVYYKSSVKNPVLCKIGVAELLRRISLRQIAVSNPSLLRSIVDYLYKCLVVLTIRGVDEDEDFTIWFVLETTEKQVNINRIEVDIQQAVNNICDMETVEKSIITERLFKYLQQYNGYKVHLVENGVFKGDTLIMSVSY